MTPAGGRADKDPARAQLAKDLAKAINANDPPPKGLVRKVVTKVVRTQRKAVAQRPKKKGAK